MTLNVEKFVLPLINAIECVEKILSCAICLETSSEPIETRCGHLFCNTCIQQILSRPGGFCPLCKLVLTRRNVMSGSQMELCVRQLSNLINAIHTDTDIDMRACLKMHCEKRNIILFPNPSNETMKTLPRVTQFDKELPRDARELNSLKYQNLTELCVVKQLDKHTTKNADDDSSEGKSNDYCEVNKANTNNKNLSKQQALTDIEIAKRPVNNCEIICDPQQLESSEKIIETTTLATMCKTVKPVDFVVNERHDDNFASEIVTLDKNMSHTAQGNKISEISNKKDKQFASDKKKEVSNNLSQNDLRKLGRSGSPKTIRAVCSAANTVSNVESIQRVSVNELQHTVPSGTIVRFKKLGHLCKENKKSATFLYFGATRRRNSSLFSGANSDTIYQISSSSKLTNEIRNEFSSMHRVDETNERLGLRKIDSYVENTFISRVRMIAPQSYSVFPHVTAESSREASSMPLQSFPLFRESEKINLEKPRSPHASLQFVERVEVENCKLVLSPKIKRKRKRSESSCENGEFPIDSENQFTNQRLKKIMGAYEVCTATRQTHRGDYALDVVTPLQVLESHAIEKPQTAVHDSNTLKRSNVTDKLPEPISSNTRNSDKNYDDTSNGILVDQGYSSSPTTIGQTSKYHELHEYNEKISSQNSMMNITEEELLLKKFETELFGPKKSGNIPQSGECKNERDVIELCKKNSEDSSQITEPTISHDRQKPNVLISDPVDSEQLCRNVDVAETIVTPPSCSSVDNDVKPSVDGGFSSSFSDIQSVADCKREHDPETPSTSTTGKSKFIGRRMRSVKQTYAKLQPIYQSTPKSSHENPIDRFTPDPDRESQIEPSSLMTCLKNDSIANSRKLEPPIGDRICIICSGLSSKQIDKVKCFSTLFRTKYTHNFSDDVTHVIVKTDDNSNAAYKTLKYLQGIASRKWVLNYNWIMECIAQRKILDEETYEVVDSTTMFPGPRRARLGDKGPFENFTVFCVPPFMNMSVTDCEDLLRRTGATVVGTFDELAAKKSLLKVFVVQADYHENKIIDWHQKTKAVPVAQEWIVECISQYRLVSFFPFLQELLPQDVLDLGFPIQIIKDDEIDFMYEL